MFRSGAKLSSHVLRNMLNEKTAKDFNVSGNVSLKNGINNKDVFLLSISAYSAKWGFFFYDPVIQSE